MAVKKTINSKPTPRRGDAPLLVMLTSVPDGALGRVPVGRASILASELANALLVPIAIQDIATGRVLKHVCPTVEGRA